VVCTTDDQLIGSFVLEGRLRADYYLHFLRGELPLLLKYVPLHTRSIMWLQHGSAPPHFGLKVTQQLNRCYGNRWIGRGDPHAWPPRSPDLTLLYLYLWGYMKDLVYQEESHTRDGLLWRIMGGVADIRSVWKAKRDVKTSSILYIQCRRSFGTGSRSSAYVIHYVR
jgi:hypothetical protein